MIETYYEEELRYLYEAGKEFAREHPDRARFLNIDAVDDRDPYVERLFEGFAFLSARIREKLDDSLPELTGGIVDLMWPQFLQEIPSLTIVEFKPRKGFLQESRILPRGAELLSNPVGREAALCRFRTTQDVRLNPISLVGIDKRVDTQGKASLTLNFQMESGIKWGNLILSQLRLYIHAEAPTALAIHELLTRHTILAQVESDGGRTIQPIGTEAVVRPSGLARSESLLPVDHRSFRGYALLLEYFAFQEKFLFADVYGLDQIVSLDPPEGRFAVTLTFDRGFPEGKPFGAENIRLFCSPAINIFRKDTEPVLNTGKETEYSVVADSQCPGSVQVHSVVSVVGIERSTGERFPYEPFHTFRAPAQKNIRTYAACYRPGLAGKRELFLTLGQGQLSGTHLRQENLSIEAWCTNGIVPREEIGEGGIGKPGRSFPEYCTFTNITRPTLPVLPPSQKDYLWVFLAHLSATYSSFSSPDALRSFLSLYEWSHQEGRARRLEAIRDVSMRPAESIFGGSAVRGVEFTIGIHEAEFKDCDDLHLFGEVLKEFFALYVSINSFVELVIVARPSGRELRWGSLRGARCPL